MSSDFRETSPSPSRPRGGGGHWGHLGADFQKTPLHRLSHERWPCRGFSGVGGGGGGAAGHPLRGNDPRALPQRGPPPMGSPARGPGVWCGVQRFFYQLSVSWGGGG